jgi:hypothetical protein
VLEKNLCMLLAEVAVLAQISAPFQLKTNYNYDGLWV